LATKIIVYITVNSLLCPKTNSYDDKMVVMVKVMLLQMVVLGMVMFLVVLMIDYV